MVERITRWIKQLFVALVAVFLGFWSVSGNAIITLRTARFFCGQVKERVEDVKREILAWQSLW